MRKLSRWKRRETTEIHRLIAESAENNTREKGIRRDWAHYTIDWWDGDRRGSISADVLEDLASELLWDGGDYIQDGLGGPVPRVPSWALAAFYRRQPDCGCTSPHLRDCHTARVERMKQTAEELERAGVLPLPPTSLPDQVLGEAMASALEPQVVRGQLRHMMPDGRVAPLPPIAAVPLAQGKLRSRIDHLRDRGADRPACGARRRGRLLTLEEFPDRQGEGICDDCVRLARGRRREEVEPLMTAFTPGIDRSGPRVYCQSTWDPDE